MWIKMIKWTIFEIAFLWKHQSLCFHYRDYLTNFYCNNWWSIIDIVERFCYGQKLRNRWPLDGVILGIKDFDLRIWSSNILRRPQNFAKSPLLTFDWHYIGQKFGGVFSKFCGLLRIYELYLWRKNKSLLKLLW